MSKKFGSDKFDKWDRQLNNWESSEFYYSPEEYENNIEEEDNDDRSGKREIN